MKVVIIGGVAGGASAAARLRRLDENAEIIMFEKGEHISFANCGLPYYIGGVIQERDELLLQTPQSMGTRFGIDIRVFSEVIGVDSERKVVKVREVKSGKEYEESFDKLVLSPGAKPIVPPLPGIQGEGIFTLRNVNDVDKIKTYIEANKISKAVVVGGGFIGIEMAENMVELGVHVDLVELAPQIMAPADAEMAAILQNQMIEHGVRLHLEKAVSGFEHDKNITVKLNTGEEIETEMVILAIGVRPDITFLQDSGLDIGERGGIVVNQQNITSHPDIYAVGDAIEVVDYINGSQTVIPLAGPANRQGRMVADHIAGLKTSYKGTQGTSVVKVFDYTFASTGNNEKTLKRVGIPYEKLFIHPGSHAGYYPGAAPITLKLIFSKEDGKVLGAQAVGLDGVEKRIDVIATAIRAGMNVFDLQELELSYAPPFSSAKDPVNMAGYVGGDIIQGTTEQFYLEDLNSLPTNAILVDVRTAGEHKMGTIEGAINIPVDGLRNHLEELPKEKEVYVFCQVGIRGYIAERILKQNGYKVKNLSGGYRLYSMVKPMKIEVIKKDKLTNAEQPDMVMKK